MSTKEVTRAYRLSQWTDIIRRCRTSGLSVTVWCDENNVSIKSYYYWLKIVRSTACESLPVANPISPKFVPVKMDREIQSDEIRRNDTDNAITMNLGSLTISIHNNASTNLIENMLRAVQNVG